MLTLKRFKQVIENRNLIRNNENLVLAVSGGPDSIALLHLLLQLQQEKRLKLHVAHVNYLLRGEDSEADQAYVKSCCQKWQVPFYLKRVQLSKRLEQNPDNLQALARKERYLFFQEVMAKVQSTTLITAHHSNDQTETFFLHLVRGTGLSGLSGMAYKKEFHAYTHIRPLLPFTKEELEGYCHVNQLQPRIDKTNFKDDYTRNYIRQHIVPSLIKLNPNFIRQMEETIETIQGDNTYLEEQARQYYRLCTIPEGEIVKIDVTRFQGIPPALQRRVILLILNCLRNNNHIATFAKTHIDQAIKLLHSTAGTKSLNLPQGLTLRREYDQAAFIPAKSQQSQSKTGESLSEESHFLNSLVEDKALTWECDGWFIFVRLRKLTYSEYLLYSEGKNHQDFGVQQVKGFAGVNTIEDWLGLDADAIEAPLLIRTRRAGDRIEPYGMSGSQKVKDIFINAKMPLQDRDKWPVITDQTNILWIPGLRYGKKGKVTSNTREVLLIEVKINREGLHSC